MSITRTPFTPCTPSTSRTPLTPVTPLAPTSTTTAATPRTPRTALTAATALTSAATPALDSQETPTDAASCASSATPADGIETESPGVPSNAQHSTAPMHTPDGRHLIFDGRKWRTSNPAIPPKLRQELVDELMEARRAVRAKDPDARPRVNNAKVALGERGAPWWEPVEGEDLTYRIVATTRAMLSKRAGASICPSDVARIVANPGTEWRDLMDSVRMEAAQLAAQGEVKILQRGVEVDALTAKGPIRIYPVSPPEEDLVQ